MRWFFVDGMLPFFAQNNIDRQNDNVFTSIFRRKQATCTRLVQISHHKRQKSVNNEYVMIDSTHIINTFNLLNINVMGYNPDKTLMNKYV